MSVLQDLTTGIAGSDIVARKAAKATKLTPVAGETATTVADVAARISDDVAFLGQEAVEGVIRTLRATAVESGRLADELERGLGKDPAAPVVDTKKPSKVEARLAGKDPVVEASLEKERQFQASEHGDGFAADYAAKSAAAQASAFTGLDDTVGEPSEGNPNTPDIIEGWQCPTHGASSLTTLTSGKGRVYKACTACGLYDKGL